ncbi:hypothetical protein CH306_28305 [Rhodococcus sp. 15-725-2-2b]|uniref:HpcH/HpaI aldolase/citrate lyase family protein n=1 Tax=unclassified Rhodococcus (in: high G+C Gram-positive bacteria) TaxID=192944 RepID=UPI000B9B867D|nr:MULTISPECIES: CoA ester lyase [unclassified Rhodococcus (in: high G+C Gram-positive bacteria)]OZC63044.1 hypothetical protein CH277_24375 [Rhodococcus sp. 06-469-3-2]OZD41444.1 hypothetical protein CH264_23445 [Rhodococcus sp. 06-1477-1A]OZE06932.1 hypothetical protein CH249_20030 [Rhodococcus sp. 05-2255-3B1]OZE12760.1 hypothetical protein CH255_26080 [Rhodococcus sp. 05-2255-2A2]OZE16936.1 hypothetical protein CH250_00630 [Rhodococcus sp. 05-2255-3C]
MNDSTISDARTLLFVPGDKPERFDKAVHSGADLTVLDLEDAVGSTDKASARVNTVRYSSGGIHVAIRINDASTPHFRDDMDAVMALECTVVLAKSTAESVTTLTKALPTHRVIALIETARGVLDAGAIAETAGVARLALGAIDLAAELGVDPNRSPLIDRARSDLAYASAAAGLPGPIDGVTPSIGDDAALDHDIARAQEFGFTGKLCIHPRQIEATHSAMAPTDAEVAWARRILGEAADPSNGSVFTVDGCMVDKPVMDRARAIAARAGRTR